MPISMTVIAMALALLAGWIWGRLGARRHVAALKRAADENRTVVEEARAILRDASARQKQTDASTQDKTTERPFAPPIKPTQPTCMPFEKILAELNEDQVTILLALGAGINAEREIVPLLGIDRFRTAFDRLAHDGIVRQWKTQIRVIDDDYRITPGQNGAPNRYDIYANLPQHDRQAHLDRFRGNSGTRGHIVRLLLRAPQTEEELVAMLEEYTPHGEAMRNIARLREEGMIQGERMLQISTIGHRELAMTSSMVQLHDLMAADTAYLAADLAAITGWPTHMVDRTLEDLGEGGYAHRRVDGWSKTPIEEYAERDRRDVPAFAVMINNQARRTIASHLDAGGLVLDDLLARTGRQSFNPRTTVANMEAAEEIVVNGGLVVLTRIGRVLRVPTITESRILLAYATGRKHLNDIQTIVGSLQAVTRAISSLAERGIARMIEGVLVIEDSRYDLTLQAFPTARQIEQWLSTRASSTNESFGQTDGYAALVVRRLASKPATREEISDLAIGRGPRAADGILERLHDMVSTGQVAAGSDGLLRITRRGAQALVLSERQNTVNDALDAGMATIEDIRSHVLGPIPTAYQKAGLDSTIEHMLELGYLIEKDGRMTTPWVNTSTQPAQRRKETRVERGFPLSINNRKRHAIAQAIMSCGGATKEQLVSLHKVTGVMLDGLVDERLLRLEEGLYQATPLFNLLYARSLKQGRVLMAIVAGHTTPADLHRLMRKTRNVRNRPAIELEEAGIVEIVDGHYHITDPAYAVTPGADGVPSVEQFAAAVARDTTGNRAAGGFTGIMGDIVDMMDGGPATRAELHASFELARQAWRIDEALDKLLAEGVVSERGTTLQLSSYGMARRSMTQRDTAIYSMLAQPMLAEEVAADFTARTSQIRKALESLQERGFVSEDNHIWTRDETHQEAVERLKAEKGWTGARRRSRDIT